MEYPEFVRQEMIVNACCHRDLSITGTDIQVKLFDDRLVVESLGNLPGLVRPDNIRHTHFSRNPRLARYLKTYKFVKEFGEGVDRLCRKMGADGLLPIKYYKNDFILRTVAWSKNAKDTGSDKVAINSDKVLISVDKDTTSGDKVLIKWSDVKERCLPNTIKILEFVSDRLQSGRTFRVLNIIDDCDRVAVGQEISMSMPAERVIKLLEKVLWLNGKPKNIRCDNGPEFISKVFQEWCKGNDININKPV